MKDSDTTDKPGQWRLKSAGLHMQTDATEAGRLIRLADVVLWLMEARELPEGAAIDAVCDKINAALVRALWQVSATDYARPWYGEACDGMERILLQPKLTAGASINEARAAHLVEFIRAAWQADPHVLERLLHDGRRPTYRADRQTPFQYYARRADDSLSQLAVTVQKACELWGWGAAETQQAASDALALLMGLRTDRGSPWTDEQRVLLRAAVEAKGGRAVSGAVGAVAEALKLDPKAVRNQLGPANSPDKESGKEGGAGWISTVFELGLPRKASK
jgi:hypothetical protein